MSRETLPYAFAFILSLLWLLFGAPLLIRLLGIAIPLNPLRRRRAGLSWGGEFLFNATAFGGGLLLFDVSNSLFRWLLRGGRPTSASLLSDFCYDLLGGVAFAILLVLTGARRFFNTKKSE